MIDWVRVKELRQEIGEDGFAEVVELFLEEVEEVISRLEQAPDPQRYESDLHFLKGSAWNLGFAEFGALCQSGERHAAGGSVAKVDIQTVLESYRTSKIRFLDGLICIEEGRQPTAA
ncbi:MAG: Hpt domain-containing protein [Paracoccaceae bacterium]